MTLSTREKIEKEFDEKLGTYTNEYGYVHNIPNYGAGNRGRGLGRISPSACV